MRSSSRKYDDWGWHLADFPDDQPPEHGMVHMAAYLAWIVRRGWYNAELITQEQVDAIGRNGGGASVEVMEFNDGKLVDELMTDEGAAFSNAYYDEYLADWGRVFRGAPAYGVRDTPDTQRRVDRLLNRRYDEWVKRGRPAQWRPSAGDGIGAMARAAFPVVILVVTAVVVALIGAVFDLRAFPWPLIQLAIVGLVLFWLLVRDQRGE